MHQLREGLKNKDLKDLMNPVFEVDSYKSKMGNDEDVIVLAFEVTGKQPAKDLSDFIEKGYDFVLDADISSGEVKRDTYKVFVEIERSIKITRQVNELLYGLSELSGIENWVFRYYKNYKSQPLIDFGTTVPTTPTETPVTPTSPTETPATPTVPTTPATPTTPTAPTTPRDSAPHARGPTPR